MMPNGRVFDILDSVDGTLARMLDDARAEYFPDFESLRIENDLFGEGFTLSAPSTRLFQQNLSSSIGRERVFRMKGWHMSKFSLSKARLVDYGPSLTGRWVGV